MLFPIGSNLFHSLSNIRNSFPVSFLSPMSLIVVMSSTYLLYVLRTIHLVYSLSSISISPIRSVKFDQHLSESILHSDQHLVPLSYIRKTEKECRMCDVSKVWFGDEKYIFLPTSPGPSYVHTPYFYKGISRRVWKDTPYPRPLSRSSSSGHTFHTHRICLRLRRILYMTHTCECR